VSRFVADILPLSEWKLPYSVQVAQSLGRVAKRFTPHSWDSDSVIVCVLVMACDRHTVEQSEIPEVFMPVTGELGMKCE
jgi:hypothetical protein